jgi:hypothetical protein
MRRLFQFAKFLGLLHFSIFLALTGCGNDKPAGKPKAVFAQIRASVPKISSASQEDSKRLQTPPAQPQALPVSSEKSRNLQNNSSRNNSFVAAPLGLSSTDQFSSEGGESSFGGSTKLSSAPAPTFFSPPSEPNAVPVLGGAPLPVFAANLPNTSNANNPNPASRNPVGENLAANNAPAGETNLPNAGRVVLKGTPNLASSSAPAAAPLPPPPGPVANSSGASENPAPRVNAFSAGPTGGETGGTNTPPGDPKTAVAAAVAPPQNSGESGDKVASASDGILSSNPDPVQAYDETLQMSLHVPGTPDFRQDVLITAPPSPDQPFTGELELKAGYTSWEDLFDCGEDCLGKTFVLRVMQCGVISEATLKEKLGDAVSPNLSDNVSKFFYRMLQGEIAFDVCPAPQYRDLKADANLKISFANFPLSVDGMYVVFLLPENSSERDSLGASALDNAVSLTGNKALWDKNAQNWSHYIRIVSSPSLIPTP